MGSWNNRLGIIAVCLSALALVVALGGRGPLGPFGRHARIEHVRSIDAPMKPDPPFAPSHEVERHERGHRAPHFGPRHDRDGHGGFGFGHKRHDRPFFGPFLMLGNALRFGAALLMIGLGLRLLRRSAGWQGPDDGPGDRPLSV